MPSFDDALLDRLRSNDASLTTLDLTANNLGDAGVQALAQDLDSNTSLTSLNLRRNNVGVEGAKCLAHALATNISLTSLDLSYNKIGEAGALALADALATNISLTSLSLVGNSIGIAGAHALAHALQTNTSLTSLNLGYNNVGDTGAQALAQALATNTSLTSLNLDFVGVGVAGLQALAQALETNTSLTSLNLRENNLGVAGAQALAQALASNTSLTSLDLRENDVADAGARALARALASNTSLTSLDLAGNQLGEAVVEHLSSLVKSNNTPAIRALAQLRSESGNLVPLLRTISYSVGPPATGKSSMRQVAGGQSLAHDVRESTRGAEALVHEVAACKGTASSDPITLSTADRTQEMKRIAKLASSSAFLDTWKKLRAQTAPPARRSSPRSASSDDALQYQTPVATLDAQQEPAAGPPRRTAMAVLREEMIASQAPQNQAPAPTPNPVAAADPDPTLQVTFFDLGGQREFESVLLPLIRDCGVYLAFLRLDEALAFLNDQPPPPLSELATFSNSPFDALVAWLTTICARSNIGSIFIVCPFLDAIETGRDAAAVSELLHRISTAIASRLGEVKHPAVPRLAHNHELVIWPINNADAASNRAAPMQALLRELTTAWWESPAAAQRVPLPTVLFADLLREWESEQGRQFISLAAAVDLFHASINPSTPAAAILDMLDYLHQLGMVTFYRDHPDLCELVVLNQPWLLDQITRVIREPKLHRLEGDSALLMDLSREWADLYHDCDDACAATCDKGGRLHPALFAKLFPHVSEPERRQLLALMIKFGLAVAVGAPDPELHIVPPLLPRSRPRAAASPPTHRAPLVLALHFGSNVCNRDLDHVSGADLRLRHHLPLGFLEQFLAALLRRAMASCSTAREMTQRLARCMLSKTRSRIDFSPDWSLLVELHNAMDIITLQLEPVDDLSHRSAVFVDEVIAIAQTVRSSFFTALGDAPDGPAPDIHITPLVLHSQGGSEDAADLRTISFVKLSALRQQQQASLPAFISSADFLAAFGWLLHSPPVHNPVIDRDVHLVLDSTVSGDRPTSTRILFYVPPPSHLGLEAFLWQAASSVLAQDEDSELQQRHLLQNFWEEFAPYLCERLGSERHLIQLELQHLAPFLCSTLPLRTVVGGSAGTGTVLGRADWDVLVLLSAADVHVEKIEKIADDQFIFSSPAHGAVTATRRDIAQLGVLYIDCFRAFVSNYADIMAPFMADGPEANSDENITCAFDLPKDSSTMDSFTLSMCDEPAGDALADFLPAIRTIGERHLLVPSAEPTNPKSGRKKFLKLARERPGLLQVAGLVKKLLRTLGDGLRPPSCVAMRLAYEVGLKGGWPAEEDIGNVWPMSELVMRCLQLLVQNVKSGNPLPPLTGPGDVLAKYRNEVHGLALTAAVQELIDGGPHTWLRPCVQMTI